MSQMADTIAEVAAREALRVYAAQWDARARNLGPVWDDVIDEFHRGEAQVLRAEGRASGWHPKYERLTDKYRAWKQRVAPGHAILDLTGRLRAALTANPAPGCFYIKDYTRLTILPGLQLPNHPGDLIAVHQMGRTGEQDRDVVTAVSTGGTGDWARGATQHRRVRTTGGRATPMKPREPVRLVKSEVRGMARLIGNYIAYGVAGTRSRP